MDGQRLDQIRGLAAAELRRRRAQPRLTPLAVMADNALFWRREAARLGNRPGRTRWANDMAKHCLRGAAPHLALADPVGPVSALDDAQPASDASSGVGTTCTTVERTGGELNGI